jgi:hypothetical protein
VVTVPDPLLKAQAHLTERDLLLMDWLHDHGVLTTPQIAHALYPSLDFAQKRLTKLVALGVIDRFRPQRPVGGSYPFHYVLDQLGTDIVTAHRPYQDPPRRGQAKARRRHLTYRANLPHLLGVNGFFTDLAGHARTHPGSSLDRWWSPSQCQAPGVFDVPGGGFHGYLPVRPDGHGIWSENGAQVAFWLEYDTGTEPLGTLAAKVRGYDFPNHAWNSLPPELRCWPVLFSLHSSGRQLHFHQRLAHTSADVPVATTARDLPAARSPAEAVWWLHHSRGIHRLADLPAVIAAQRAARQAAARPSLPGPAFASEDAGWPPEPPEDEEGAW